MQIKNYGGYRYYTLQMLNDESPLNSKKYIGELIIKVASCAFQLNMEVKLTPHDGVGDFNVREVAQTIRRALYLDYPELWWIDSISYNIYGTYVASLEIVTKYTKEQILKIHEMFDDEAQ